MICTTNRNLQTAHRLDGKIKRLDCLPKFEKF
jgi:hypothetical protein